MRKMSLYLCSFLLLVVGLISSCTSTPEYGKMIPKDAYAVISFNAEDAYAGCDIGDLESPRKTMDSFLSYSVSAGAREQFKNLMENPKETGVDFSSPVMLFVSASLSCEVGCVGGLKDADKFEDMLNALSKEGLCQRVLERDGLRYSVAGRTVLAFSDSWFFTTDKVGEQSELDVVEEIKRLSAQEASESMAENKAFKAMCEKKGFLHVMVMGKGLEQMLKETGASYKTMMPSMPQNMPLEDFSLIADAGLGAGEATLSVEVMPLSDKAEEWVENNMNVGKIEGNLNEFISQQSLCYGVGVAQGKMILEQLKASPDYAQMLQNPEMKKLVESFLAAVDGDMAVSVDFESGVLFPQVTLLAQVSNRDWLDLVVATLGEGVEKIDDRTYAKQLGAMLNGMNMEMVFGEKRGVAYLLIGDQRRVLDKEENPITVDGGYGYARFNASNLLQIDLLKNQMGPLAYMPFRQIVELFDYAECNSQNALQAEFRLVMKDKDHSPVRTIYEQVEKVMNFAR